MHRACTRLRQRNPNLFIVESLFANGEQGGWYDPSDLNSLFQDAAGTIPVTASGDPVGLMRDKSGRGNHASQATAGSRPTFRDVGGLRYLEFDGVDDFLVTANINFTAFDKMSAFAGLRKLSDAAIGAFYELSVNSSTSTGAFGMLAPSIAAAANISIRTHGTALSQVIFSGVAAPISLVSTMIADIPADSVAARLNGVAGTTSTTDMGVANYGNYPLYIGRRAGTSLPFNGQLHGLIIRSGLTDSTTIASTERYLAARAGVTLA